MDIIAESKDQYQDSNKQEYIKEKNGLYLLILSYLTDSVIFLKMAKLSKSKRDLLISSYFIREKRHLIINLWKNFKFIGTYKYLA